MSTSLFGGGGESDQERSAKLESHVHVMGLHVKQLKVDVHGETATVSGEAASQAEREKVLLSPCSRTRTRSTPARS